MKKAITVTILVAVLLTLVSSTTYAKVTGGYNAGGYTDKQTLLKRGVIK